MTVYQAPRPPSSLVPRSYCRFQLLRLKSDEIDRAIMLRMSVSAAPYDGRCLGHGRGVRHVLRQVRADWVRAATLRALDAACNDAALAVDAACNDAALQSQPATPPWRGPRAMCAVALGLRPAAICSMWAMALATAGGGRWQSL